MKLYKTIILIALICLLNSIDTSGSNNSNNNKGEEHVEQKGLIKVLTLNVLNSIAHGGWNDLNWKNSGKSRGLLITKVIEKSGADIVCLQEYLHNDRWIEKAMEQLTSEEWYLRICPRNCAILSKYPIQDHGNIYLTPVEIKDDLVIYMISGHMNVNYFLPYLLGSKSVDEACDLVIKSNQDMNWKHIISEATNAVNRGQSVIIAGDFNEPSHLDYTPKVVKKGIVPATGLRGLMSNILIDSLGYKDSWVEHRKQTGKDECSLRGFTWSPTTWNYKKIWDDQRIDFIYYHSDVISCMEAKLVGETPNIKIDGDNVEVQLNPWPSDHRGVLAIFKIN